MLSIEHAQARILKMSTVIWMLFGWVACLDSPENPVFTIDADAGNVVETDTVAPSDFQSPVILTDTSTEDFIDATPDDATPTPELDMGQQPASDAATLNPDMTPRPDCVPRPERCDGLDNDCDGRFEEAVNGVDPCQCVSGTGFEVCLASMNWMRARQICQSKALDLAIIRNADEMASMATLSFEVLPEDSRREAWIGLSDRNIEGTFVWVNQDGLEYEAWHDGEPNDEFQEDCATLQFEETRMLVGMTSIVPYNAHLSVPNRKRNGLDVRFLTNGSLAQRLGGRMRGVHESLSIERRLWTVWSFLGPCRPAFLDSRQSGGVTSLGDGTTTALRRMVVST